MNSQKNMASYLEKIDLIFDDVRYKGGFYTENEVFHTLVKCYRREWDEGVFTGNGMVGVMVYKLSPDVTMWELGRNDVTAHNMIQGADWATPRVPIGNVLLKVEDKIINETMRIHLHGAFVSGTITTDSGKLSYVSYVPRDCDGVYIKITMEGSVKYSLNTQPRHGISDRIYFANKKVDLSLLPPAPYIKSEEDITYSVQEFVAEDENGVHPEGACVLAWKEVKTGDTFEYFIAIDNGDLVDETVSSSVSYVKKFYSKKENILELHAKWWNDFYLASFVSIDDKDWNQFYWLQMYKLACSTRPNGVVIDSQGPFMTTTTWPTTVWNLNVELSYSPTFVSNHIELVDSLISVLLKNKQNLIDNAKPMGIEDGMYLSRATSPSDLSCLWPDTHEFGNLLWVLFTVDRKQQIFPDERLVKELLHPYLAMTINAATTLFETDSNGVIHIKDTSSPEYPSVKGANWHPIYDCSYTISLLRWGLKRIIELDNEYNIGDPMLSTWKDLLNNLTEEPTDENGYMIGRDIPMAISHRHFSHLMMIYPLSTMDFEDETKRKLAIKSIEHWLSLEKRLQGYTFTGAAGMMACLKDGDRALEYLNGLNDFLCPNTMYSEFAQVIETPLSAAESIHTMLLQSHGGVVQPLAAIPTDWHDIEFENLLANGGFAVSATRKNGKTENLEVKSLCGKPLCLRLPDDLVEFECSHEYSHKCDNKKLLTINLSIGEVVSITKIS